MSISGISHITFIVRDLERARQFWCDGLGAQMVYDSGKRYFSTAPERFFVLGGVWIAVMQGEPAERSYRHVAFAVDEASLPEYERNLQRLGVRFQPPRPRIVGEGLSLYVHDFDGHLIEMHTGTLEQRLASYRALSD